MSHLFTTTIRKNIERTAYISTAVSLWMLYPQLAFAQNSCSSGFEDITDLLNFATCFLGRSVVPFLMLLAFTVFIWGMVRFVANGNDETKRTEGRKFMLWGIIGLFVMVALWGILEMLGNTLGLGGSTGIIFPQL